MIVKNEQANLPRCLDSLKGLLGSIQYEVIIVDTGSTDNTVEIARKYTSRVYSHLWTGDFAEMRNRSISYAQGEWILVLDADEELTEVSGLIKFLKSSKRDKYNAASISFKNVKKKLGSNGGYQDFSRIPLIRLFKNDGDFRYENPIHEQPRFKLPVLFLTKTLVTHYGYDATDKELMDYKFKRNVDILRKELEKDPENVYYIFQMSQSYSMYGKKEQALIEAERAYRIYKSQGLPNKLSFFIYSQLALCYSNSQKFSELKDICIEGLSIEPDSIDMYFFLGRAYTLLNDYEKSIESYSQYFNLLENYENTMASRNTSLGTLSIYNRDDALISTALAYYSLQDYAKALDFLDKIQDKESENFFKLFTRVNFERSDFETLKSYYEEINSELKERFISFLEGLRKDLDSDKDQKFLEIFSKGKTHYSLLNSARIAFKQDKNIEDILSEFNKSFVWTKSNQEFYAEILYYSMIRGISIDNIFFSFNQSKLAAYFNYLNVRYNDLDKTIKNYLPTIYGDGFQQVKIRKSLLGFLLLLDENIHYYNEVFRVYVKNGIQYLQSLYAKEILDNEWVQELKNEEEAFFLYINLSERQLAGGNPRGAIEYLRKALNQYPIMNKGIKALLNNLEENLGNNQGSSLLRGYKSELMSEIEKLINSGKILEAKAVISEYETLIKEDNDFLSFKAVILMLENNQKEAEAILLEGLIINPSDFDIHFNLAYLYQTMEEHKLALMYYKKARNLAPQDKILLVENAMKNIV